MYHVSSFGRLETFTENWVLWITSAVYKTFAWKYFPSVIVGRLENIILFVYHDAKTLLILMDKLFSRWKERHIGYEEKLLNLDVFAKKGFVYDPQNNFFFFLVLTVWLRASLTSMFPHLVKSCILVELIGIERFSSCTECISGTFRSFFFLSLFYWI